MQLNAGQELEATLKEFLKKKLPRRFDVASGILIGCDNAISRQTDVIIYDAMNSPVYRSGPRIKFCPATTLRVLSRSNRN